MKRVLLLGDSIRLGYQPLVAEALRGEAEVVGPEDNGRFAKYTLWGVNGWLREFGPPAVVHWNNGLWDLNHEAPMVEALTPLGEYLETLRRTLCELQRIGAAIVFATTTPVPVDAIGRSNAEIDLYNEAASALMARLGVAVNDLNAVLRQDLATCIDEDRLHLSDEGNRRCARAVVGAVRSHL